MPSCMIAYVKSRWVLDTFDTLLIHLIYCLIHLIHCWYIWYTSWVKLNWFPFQGNGTLQESINIAIIQATHPNLYQIFAGYTTRPRSLSATNRQHIFVQLSEILKQRCIKLLESLNGSEESSDISVKQLLHEIDTHLKKIPLILVEVSTSKNRIRNNICKLNNLIQKYQIMLDKYSKECLPTKLNFDKLMVSHLCVQTEECRRLERWVFHTLSFLSTFSVKESIQDSPNWHWTCYV